MEWRKEENGEQKIKEWKNEMEKREEKKKKKEEKKEME